MGSNSGTTARGGLVSAAHSSSRLIIRSSKVADTKREGTAAQNDFIDCKNTNHCVLDEFTADVTFAEQNVDLKTNMACPASGTNFDVGHKYTSDVGTDYNYCKSGETCATGVADYTIVCSAPSQPTSGTWTLTADKTLTGEIELTGDLTVNGGGHTLTAAAGKRLFKTGSHKLVLNNVTLTGGDLSGVTTDCGGGDTDSDGCSGGAVLVVAGTLEANDSKFLSNKGFKGSAIFARNGATVTLTDCKVNNNENTLSKPDDKCRGGAIATAKSTTKVHIIRGEVNYNDVKNNKFGCKAGGLAASDGHFNVTGTTIKGNKGRMGGAIYIYRYASFTLTDAIVEDNTATMRGGGMQIYIAPATITNSIIRNNVATYEGAGIFVHGSGNSLTTITGSTIEGNNRTGVFGATNYGIGGGGICIDKRTVEIRQTTFKNNKDDDGNGHHIFTKRSTTEKPVITLVNNEYLGATGNILGGYEDGTNSATNFEAAKTCTDSPCSKDPFKGTCADLSDNKGVTCDCTSGTLEPSTYGASTCCGPTGCSASSSGADSSSSGDSLTCGVNTLAGSEYEHIIMSSSGRVLTSQDGIKWSQKQIDASSGAVAMVYVNDKYSALFRNTNKNDIRTSSDGITWSSPTSVTTDRNCYDLTYVKDKYFLSCNIITGGNGFIYSSTDGTTWTSHDLGIANDINTVGGSDTLYVAAGDSGKILTSTDGTSWTERTSGTTSHLTVVAYHDGLYVIAGNSGTIPTSTDGTTWTSRSGATGTAQSLKYLNGYWIQVATSGYISYSSDGTTWLNYRYRTTSAQTLYDVSYLDGKYYVVSSSSRIYKFADISINEVGLNISQQRQV